MAMASTSMRLPKPLKRVLKSTQFFQDNALIFNQLRHFPGTLTLAIVFPLLAAIFEGFGIGFLLGFMQNLLNQSGEAFATGIQWFDQWVLGVNKSDLNRLVRVSSLILLTTWVRAIFNYLGTIYQKIAEEKLVNRLYKQIFEQLQSLSLTFYSNTKSGDLINTLTVEVNQLRQSISALGFFFSRGSVIVVYAAIAMWISWQLTLVTILSLGLIAMGISTLTRRVREHSFPVTRARGNFAALASEIVIGMRTVKAFAAENQERQRVYQASDQVMYKGIDLIRRLAIVAPISESLASTVLIGIIILAMAVLVPNGQMQVASLLTFLFTIFRMVPTLQQLNGTTARLVALQGSIHSIEDLLRRDNKPYTSNGYRPFSGLKQAIELIAVDFGYSSEQSVLQDITLTIEKGKTTALVGGSGAGKSTLADLIPRFYAPTSGHISFDGIDQREFDLHSLRKKIGIVSQDTFIFNASAKDNIAYGTERASHENIIEAAKLANALQFIEELPNGFETILGDRGVMLSGGQRQRIAIARALLKNPDILILDEATSALDSVSEKLIQESLEKLTKGRTVITIAHRLSTITNSDKVVVLDKGKIIEQGSYQELLNHRGKLWDYHKIQTSSKSL